MALARIIMQNSANSCNELDAFIEKRIKIIA